MTITHQEHMASLSPERRAKILAGVERIAAEHKTLKQMKKAKIRAYKRIAKAFGIQQPTLERYEVQADILLSTLRSYVEAAGGELELKVRFPDHVPVVLGGIRDTEEHHDPDELIFDELYRRHRRIVKVLAPKRKTPKEVEAEAEARKECEAPRQLVAAE